MGAVHAAPEPPSHHNRFSSAFAVGSAHSRTWSGPKGTLWFTVNDVWDHEDDRLPQKFFIDNMGFFVVRVTVKRD